MEPTVNDNLMGLVNHHGFAICFQHSVNNNIEKCRNLSLLLLNLDGFEQINEKFGDQSGDLVLTSLAKILSDCISSQDQVFRYGEEKFTVILNDTDENKIPIIIARIKKAILENALLLEFNVSCSIGSSNYQEEDDLDSLFERAENALYQAEIDTEYEQEFFA